MAADGKSFGISLGINFAILTGCLLFFGLFRQAPFTRKFYAPRRYMRTAHRKPKRLPTGFWAWFLPVYRTTEEEVIEVAGMDACMYLRALSFGREFFAVVSLWVLLTCLPTNLVGKEVDRLSNPEATSMQGNFTYWVSPPPPLGAPPGPSAPAVAAPNFYNNSIPDPPPGLVWYKYDDDVPPLPQVEAVLGPQYKGYIWMYDTTYQTMSYAFSNLDLLTMSNIEARSMKMWVHTIAVWFATFYCYRLLWRYSREAVALRIRYLTGTKKGAESHSICVFDIPGLYAGTVRRRLEELAFFVPDKAKEPMRRAVDRVFEGLDKGAEAVNKASTVVLGDTTSGTGTKSVRPGLTHMDTMHDIYFDADAGDDIEAPPARSNETLKDANSDDAVKPGFVHNFQGPIPEANRPPKRFKNYESVTEGDAWEKAALYLDHGMSPAEYVERQYNDLYPGAVEAVHVVYNTTDLDALFSEYNNLQNNLQDLLDVYTSMKRRHKKIVRKQVTVLPLKYGQWGKSKYGSAISVKVDALEFYVARMTELKRQIQLKQVETKHDAKENVEPTAFVTFKTRKMQVVASSCMQHHDVSAWRVEAAPAPPEIIWHNLRFRSWERTLRSMLGWGVFMVMTLFFFIPIGLIQSLLQVQKLASIKGIGAIINIPFVTAILTAVLPGLALTIFLALVPTLLKIINQYSGFTTKSAVDFGVVRKYFIFQVIVVFFGSFIAGSFLNQIQQWIKHPGAAVTILGTAAPLTSIFFLNYIELQALTVGPIGLLRIPQFLIFYLRTQLASTERSKAKCWQDQVFEYGPMLPRHTMVIMFGLVFCAINPLVPAMALLYFVIVSILEKYSMLYIYGEQYQSGGQLWRQIFEHVIASLVIFQGIMCFMLFIKRTYLGFIVAPLIFLTLLFRNACLTLFERPLQVLSIRAATDMDENDRTGQVTEKEVAEIQQMYLSPAFKFDEATFESLKSETEYMDAVLKGTQEVSKADVSPHESEHEEEDLRSQAGPSRSRSAHPVAKDSIV